MEKVAYTEGGILKRKKKGGAIMATVFDVAKYILHKMGRINLETPETLLLFASVAACMDWQKYF